MNNKKLIIERLDQLKVESGLSDKSFKNTLASLTGKTPRTVRRWYSFESNIHENDIDRIAKFFGKHVHWLRYGDSDREQISTAVDQIMYSDHFAAIVFKDDKVEEANFKFIEMMDLADKNIPKQDYCEYVLKSQSEETAKKCKHGHDKAIEQGACVDQMIMTLGDEKKHHVESTTLHLNNNRTLRILFDKGLVSQSGDQTGDQNITKKACQTNQKKLNILFVDDDLSNCQLYNSMLSIHCCDVKTFNNSLHALHEFKLNHQDYDLIISDIIMPDMTGDKLAEECRLIRPDIPVILCSGYADHLNKSTAEEFGVSYYLQKPIDSSELLHLLEKHR